MSGCSYPYCLFSNSGVELIATGKTVIGRSLLPIQHVNVINLDSPRCAVSRLQAQIIVHDNGDAWVKDCNSTNGTFISIHPSGTGLRLAENHYYQLTPGAHLTFGDVQRQFRVYSQLYDVKHKECNKQGSNAVSSHDTDKLYSHAHDLPQQQCNNNDSQLKKLSNDSAWYLQRGSNAHIDRSRANDDIDFHSVSNKSIQRSQSTPQSILSQSLQRSQVVNDVDTEKIRKNVIMYQRNERLTSSSKLQSDKGQTAAEVDTSLNTLAEKGTQDHQQSEHVSNLVLQRVSLQLLPLSQNAQDPLLYSSTQSNNEMSVNNDVNTESVNELQLKEREVNALSGSVGKKTKNFKRQRNDDAQEMNNFTLDSTNGLSGRKKNVSQRKQKIKAECCNRVWNWDELKICLSGMDLSQKLKISRRICKHGACVVDDIVDANCLIVHTPAVRTPKVIIAVGRGIPILDSSILSHAKQLTLHDLQNATVTIKHDKSIYTPKLLCHVIFRADRSPILQGNYYNLSSLPDAVSTVASDIIVKCGGVICNDKGNKKRKQSGKVICLNQKKLNELYEQVMRGQRKE